METPGAKGRYPPVADPQRSPVDTLRQCRRFAPLPARYGARHDGGMERLPGRRMRLLEVIDLADMLGSVRGLEGDALAMRHRGKRRP